MSKELEALNILRDNHIQFTKEKYGKLDKEKMQNIINLKLARWDILEKALKRNEPMKPKLVWKNEEDKNIVAYRCLNCNGSLGAKLDDKPMFPNFCRHCGQKLDWSDDK